MRLLKLILIVAIIAINQSCTSDSEELFKKEIVTHFTEMNYTSIMVENVSKDEVYFVKGDSTINNKDFKNLKIKWFVIYNKEYQSVNINLGSDLNTETATLQMSREDFIVEINKCIIDFIDTPVDIDQCISGAWLIVLSDCALASTAEKAKHCWF